MAEAGGPGRATAGRRTAQDAAGEAGPEIAVFRAAGGAAGVPDALVFGGAGGVQPLRRRAAVLPGAKPPEAPRAGTGRLFGAALMGGAGRCCRGGRLGRWGPW